MIGKYQVQLGADQIISGMSSSDWATDGALGTSSFGLNPFLKPGVIRAIANGTNINSPIAGNIIASCEDAPASNTLPAFNRVFVDDVANYYTIDTSNAVLKKKTGTATTHYASGKTDMVSYAGNIYTSLDNDISIWNPTGGSFTESWWVTTKSKSALLNNCPHPLLVYQGIMWIGDGNQIDSWDGTTATQPVLSLASNEIIYALGIDPTTGLMMISVQTEISAQDIFSARNFVYLWDGISLKPLRKIPVDDQITAFYNVGGTVYIGAGLTIGQWNGNGVTFLRKLANATFSGPESYTDVPYKHHFANTRNILHVIDGHKILSYGEVVAGKKGWFYTATNAQANHHNLSCVMPLGSYQIGIAFATTTLSVYDFTATGVGSGNLYFNNIYFPRPIYVRRVRIIATGLASGANGSSDSFSIISEKAVETVATCNGNHAIGTGTYPQSTTATTYIFDFDFSNLKLQGLQLRHQYQSLVNIEHVRFIVYYDIAE